eukprot:jgi/Psemu1/221635/e_gw1.1142.19.1
MHGKKREEYKAKTRDSKTATILAIKAEQWYILMKELQGRRRQEQGSPKDHQITLQLLGKALEVNPDPSNLWNHRREIVLSTLETLTTNIVQRERVLTQKALERNPKAYGAWFHRKWILQKLRPPPRVFHEELTLTKQFLRVDERNFHCWNYRRFVGNKTNNASNRVVLPTELIRSELDFTTEKIKENFSNFSAFHYRSQLLDLCHNEGDACNLKPILEEEFQLIEDAVCTEPDDQTCWWYHSILLDKLVMADSQNDNDGEYCLLSALLPRLQEQAELLREILEDSPNSKWVILGLFRVVKLLGTITDSDTGGDEQNEEGGGNDSINSAAAEQQQLLQRLVEIDPYRSKRYEELRATKEMNKL